MFVLYWACYDAGRMRCCSWDHCYSERLGAGLVLSKKARSSKSCQRLLFQEQHPLLSPWAKQWLWEPSRARQGYTQPLLWLCACVTQPAALAELSGKGKHSVWKPLCFLLYQCDLAKYWKGERDFGYGRGRKLDALNCVPSGFWQCQLFPTLHKKGVKVGACLTVLWRCYAAFLCETHSLYSLHQFPEHSVWCISDMENSSQHVGVCPWNPALLYCCFHCIFMTLQLPHSWEHLKTYN